MPAHDRSAASQHIPTSAREWTLLFAELDPTEIPALLQQARALRDPYLRNYVVAGLLGLWATEAPEAAWRWAAQAPGLTDLERANIFATLFSSWAERDPFSAAAAISAKQAITGFAKVATVRGIASSWAAHDPAGALAWARQQTEPRLRQSALTAISLQLSRTDLQQAIAVALETAPFSRQDVLSAILFGQAREDPATALRAIQALPSAVARGPLYASIVKALAAEDAKLAGEFALTIPASQYRNDALQTATSQMAPAAALDWLESSLPASPMRSQLLRDTIMSLSAFDPAAAVPLLDHLSGPARTNILRNSIRNWVGVDAEAATAWVRQLSPGQDRTEAIESLCGALSSSSRAATVALAQTLTEPSEQASVFRSIGVACNDSSLAEARTLYDQLPSDAARTAFVNGLFSLFPLKYPQAATQFVTDLPSGPVQLQAANRLVATWAMSDPQAAGRWAQSLPESPTRLQATIALAHVWAGTDRPATTQWIGQLPAGRERDFAAVTYLNRAARDDLPLAAKVCTAIAKPDTRYQAITAISTLWLRADRDTAAAWLATTDLPEETKQKLLAPTP
jgi:hypothetical protein